MITTNLTVGTVIVDGKPIFVAETGTGPAVVMLHGGGPGASGVSNYARNIDALAQQFRVIVPDMPGYGRSTKQLGQSDPFGCLADMIRGLLDELGIDIAHLVGNSYGGAATLRLALDTPHRVGKLVLMGPGGIGTTRGIPTSGLKSLLSYYSGGGPSREKLEHFIRTYLVYDGASVPDEDRPAVPGIDRPRGAGQPAAAAAVGTDGATHAVAHGPHARQSSEGVADSDAGAVGQG